MTDLPTLSSVNLNGRLLLKSPNSTRLVDLSYVTNMSLYANDDESSWTITFWTVSGNKVEMTFSQAGDSRVVSLLRLFGLDKVPSNQSTGPYMMMVAGQ